MIVNDNGINREMTAEEIAELEEMNKLISKDNAKTIEDLKSEAFEMQSQLAELLEKINRLESEVQADE